MRLLFLLLEYYNSEQKQNNGVQCQEATVGVSGNMHTHTKSPIT